MAVEAQPWVPFAARNRDVWYSRRKRVQVGEILRVISGNWRGHRLDAPSGTVARPTTDRVKESMFNLMGPNWTGELAVDLFAGSGALGIEALSRGAERAVFVDKSPRSIAAVRTNLERLHALSEASLVVADWQTGWRRAIEGRTEVGWVFVDPPYAKQLWVDVLSTIAESGVTVVHGIVCEHPRDVDLPEAVGSLQRIKERIYGDIVVTIYKDARYNQAPQTSGATESTTAASANHEWMDASPMTKRDAD